MNKGVSNKSAFTLIEVMVAVMIISVVIMALIEMFSNNTHTFKTLKSQTKINQYTSLFIANEKYGFENKNINLYALVDDFDLESDLRRELKEIKIELVYQELDSIDFGNMDETQEGEEESTASNMVFEVGKSIIRFDDASTGLMRFKLQ